MSRAMLCAVFLLQLFLHSSALCRKCDCKGRIIRCDGQQLEHPLINCQVSNASKIDTIKIVKCELKEAEIVDADFKECFTLTSLLITDVNLTKISEFALSDLRRLVSIVIDNAGLKSIPKQLFEGNKYLDTVRLTRNNIETILPGTFPDNLTELDLSGNYIKILDFQAFSSSNLVLLLLDNPIENVGNFIFSNVTFPKELHLDSQVDLYHNRDLLDKLKSSIHVHFRCTQVVDIVTYVHKRSYPQNLDGHENSNLEENYRQQCLNACTKRLGKICDVPCPLVCDHEHGITDATSERGESFSTPFVTTPDPKAYNSLTTTMKDYASDVTTQQVPTSSTTGSNNENTNNQTNECSCMWSIGFAVLGTLLVIAIVVAIAIAIGPKLFKIIKCSRNNDNVKTSEEEPVLMSVRASPQVSPRRRKKLRNMSCL